MFLTFVEFLYLKGGIDFPDILSKSFTYSGNDTIFQIDKGNSIY